MRPFSTHNRKLTQEEKKIAISTSSSSTKCKTKLSFASAPTHHANALAAAATVKPKCEIIIPSLEELQRQKKEASLASQLRHEQQMIAEKQRKRQAEAEAAAATMAKKKVGR